MGTEGEQVRKDSKIRLLGNRSYVGDQEIIGEFQVRDSNENLIFFVDPENNLINMYNTAGVLIYSFDTANGRILQYNSDGDEIYRFDTSSGKIQMKNTAGTVIFEFNPDTGILTINGDVVNTNAEVFSHLSIEHFWTASATYIDRVGCRFALDGDNFGNQNVYFECVMANEQAGRIAYARIYNITDAGVLAGSEITTNVNPLTSLARIRSTDLTLPSELKEYKLQIRMNQTGGAGNNAHFYAARLVITQT